MEAVLRDHGLEAGVLLEPLADRLVWVGPGGGAPGLVAAVETAPRLLAALYGRGAEVALEPILSGAAVPEAARPRWDDEADPDEDLTNFVIPRGLTAGS